MSAENKPLYPWVIVDGVDYSGKSTLSRELAITLGGITVRSIPLELTTVRQLVEQYCDVDSRYNFFIASAFFTYHRLQGILLKQGPVVVDRWMYSTNIHHKLLGLQEEKLLPPELIPRSKFMYFTSVSYKSWLKRKIARNEHGVDDDFIDDRFIREMNTYLKDHGLIEINTDQMTPQESVNFIMRYIIQENNFQGGSILTNC